MNHVSNAAPRTVVWLRDEAARAADIEEELRRFERE